MDDKGKVGFGTSSHFSLPMNIIDKLLSGIELGKVIDDYY